MLIFGLYVFALASPVLLFYVITLVVEPSGRSPHRQAKGEALDGEIAVMEAQFLVAPRKALRELRERLGGRESMTDPGTASAADLRGLFEAALRSFERDALQHGH